MILALQGVPLVLVSILAFIIIIGLVVVVHEGGHFFFARRAGILCHEFSIGMGPAIYKKKIGETTFCIRAIPIGGYVSMAGEEITADLIKKNSTVGLNLLDGKVSEIIVGAFTDSAVKGEVIDFDLYGKDGSPLYITVHDGLTERYLEVLPDAFYIINEKQRMQITPYHRSFESKTLWQRFLTLFAGPFMNFLLAIVLYLIVSFASGVPDYSSTTLGVVSSSMPASSVLQVGDQITKMNGVSVSNWNELSAALDNLVEEGKTSVSIEFIRDGITYQEEVSCTTYIASLGLSNIQAEEKSFPDGIDQGLIVGNLALRYVDEGKKGSYPLSYGDILLKVRIDHFVGKQPQEGEITVLKDWGQLVTLFNDTDVANVYFEYYSYQKQGIVTIEDCIQENVVLQTYGDEVLTNQRIEKIQIKIGISPENHFDFFGAIGLAFGNFWDDFTLIFRTLALLIAPSGIRQVGVSDLSSFVGIFSLVETFIGAGFLSLLAFTALLSVNLGVMNLLPIPALDGGRIVFLGYELVTRKKPSKKVENIINNIFFILLLILFVVVTYNDILRLIRK